METKKTRNIYVKQATVTEITIHWKFRPMKRNGDLMYVKCNKKGEVNWETTSVYNHRELIEKNNIIIIEN